MSKKIIFIPARFKSRRFPGKLMKKINGCTILESVSKKIKNINYKPVVVSGDKEIINFLKKKKISSIKSKQKHISGMSRISEVVNKNSPKIIYILFGDELYLKEQEISNFIKFVELQNKDSCWHLLTNIKNSDRNDQNVVKCRVNKKKEVKDFSRKYKNKYNYKCVGLFAFRREVLINYNKYKKSNREIKMKVEQFKLLDNHIKIKSLIIKNIQNSINSVKDLKSGN